MMLYLCRHGETDWTLSGQHTGKSDVALTASGERQGILVRKRLQGIHFEKVFTSPLKRASETCKGMGAIADERLVEWDYGDYEGRTSVEIHRERPGWNLFRDGAPHGEDARKVGKRADEFLKSLGKGNVAIFSHGHFLRVLAARFLGWAPEMGMHLEISVGSVGILGYEHDVPVIILWNDVHHLSL